MSKTFTQNAFDVKWVKGAYMLDIVGGIMALMGRAVSMGLRWMRLSEPLVLAGLLVDAVWRAK